MFHKVSNKLSHYLKIKWLPLVTVCYCTLYKAKCNINTTMKNINLKCITIVQDPGSNNKLKSDPYCWRCHWAVEQVANEKNAHPPMVCTVCPRAFHYKCLSGAERSKISTDKSWVCPECMGILHAESSETRLVF